MNGAPGTNADPAELARFSSFASRWWDPEGEMRMLHRMNPIRVGYMQARVGLAGKRCLDIGCGAGLLSEALAGAGAEVTGIDLAPDLLTVARLHLLESGCSGVTYECIAAEELAQRQPARFDVVSCMEVLEHVPDPASIVSSCARLVRPGGDVFLSTISRTPLAFLVTVLGAEYLTRMLPRGTHQWEKFIRPSELAAWARQAGLQLLDLSGMRFDPVDGGFTLARNVQVNYLAHLRAPGAGQ